MAAPPHLKAESIIKKYCFDGPEEINPIDIAGAENICVEREPSKSYQGRIVFGKGYGLIKINSNIIDENQLRFVVSHELGHYFNEGTGTGSCNTIDLLKYKSDNNRESNANYFASELLMYEPWFTDFCRGRSPGAETVKNISTYFRVSLSAAAIRYAHIGKIAIAVIMTKNGAVQWSWVNEYFPFKFVKKGQRVNSFSYCNGFFKGNEFNTDINEVLADAWFLNDFNYKPEVYFKEQNIWMPNYKSVLTLLWEL